MNPMAMLTAVERVLTTLWVGGLWVVGYLAVPILFYTLDDRKLAGELAGRMFTTMNTVGLICGVAILALMIGAARHAWFRSVRCWVVVAMLVIVAASAFGLQPMMQELKATGLLPGSAEAAQFGRLHGVSSALYMVLSVLGLVLVIRGQAPKT